MSDKTIQKLLKLLNDNKYQNNIFLKSLNGKIDFGIVWIETNNQSYELVTRNIDKNYYPVTTYDPYCKPIYFIKDVEGKEGQYVAAVFDMGHDLHWFVEELFRKQGHLTCALNDVILPHLFLNRKEQRVSIDWSQIEDEDAYNSEKVALKVGFKLVEEVKRVKEYTLSKKQVRKFAEFPNSHVMSKERLEVLINRLEFLTTSIEMLKSEFEASIGKNAKLQLLKIKLTSDQFEDLWWDFRRK